MLDFAKIGRRQHRRAVLLRAPDPTMTVAVSDDVSRVSARFTLSPDLPGARVVQTGDFAALYHVGGSCELRLALSVRLRARRWV
ncbi:MAG: hypothetical protein ABMA02_00765, partial [Saprospiraceae bacterium]